MIEQQDGAGFTNPWKHFRGCVYKGYDEAMEAANWEVKASKLA